MELACILELVQLKQMQLSIFFKTQGRKNFLTRFYFAVSNHMNLLVSHMKWLVLLDTNSQTDERKNLEEITSGVISFVKREMVAQISLL